jgi:site-specific DNA recombinase
MYRLRDRLSPGVSNVQRYKSQEGWAKRGRPIFGRMLKDLKLGKADGIVVHKIDRSALILKDWADLGELIDHGHRVR